MSALDEIERHVAAFKARPIQRRLIQAAAEISAAPADETWFLHTAFCQAYLPASRPNPQIRTWERQNGDVTICLEAGHAFDPVARTFAPLPLPYGAKARLALIGLISEAVCSKSPEIDTGRSMTAFLAELLQRAPAGRDIRQFRQQLAALIVATTAAVMGALGTAITVTRAGVGYTALPDITIAGDGEGAAATASTAPTANPVVSEMIGLATRMRAVIVAEGPATTDEAAVTYRRDWGTARVYTVDPFVSVWDTSLSMTVMHPGSAWVAGLIAQVDNTPGKGIRLVIMDIRYYRVAFGGGVPEPVPVDFYPHQTVTREVWIRFWGGFSISEAAGIDLAPPPASLLLFCSFSGMPTPKR